MRIHCTASWIHPDTRDQHLLIAAEEGIYNLNLNELHETAIDQLYPRRTIWMYVIKDVLMSLSGKIFIWLSNRYLIYFDYIFQVLCKGLIIFISHRKNTSII